MSIAKHFSRIVLMVALIVTIYLKPALAKSDSKLDYKPGELIVCFAPKENQQQRSKEEKNAVLSHINGGHVMKEFRRNSGLTIVSLPPGRTVSNSIKDFQKLKDVLYVEPNYKIRLYNTYPDDPSFQYLWGLHNTGQASGIANADIDAPEAWDIRTSSNIIVADIDTGVDYTHPDLAANIWINETELNGDSDVDDDGNGYVDDIYGYDFSGYTPQDQDDDPMDEHYHGTHVAGTIGAVGNNETGVVGVCWDVKVMPLKIMPPYYISEWVAFVDNAVEAIEYAVDNGANVINASWGIDTNYSEALEDTISDAGDAGVIFVAAAGNAGRNNDATPIYPSCYDLDNIISVMATDHYDLRSGFSCYGSLSVDLGAPGSDILSTFPTSSTSWMLLYGLSSNYETISGTSMAAPHVSGACALVWAEHPDWTHLQVKQALLDSVDKLTSLQGLCVSNGRLNLYKAIDYKPPLLAITKDDGWASDPNICRVQPEDTITYTIEYGNPVTDSEDPDYLGTTYNTIIVDYLPKEVFYPENGADPNTGVYDIFNHTYTWDIGTLQPGDSGSVTITVVVNEMAEPLGEIKNEVMIESDEARSFDSEITQVCHWGGDVIYVKADSNGYNGTSWDMAYRDLELALLRAGKGCTTEIRVAGGVYVADGDGFALLDDVDIFGGYRGNGPDPNERDFVKYKTFLSGNETSANVIKAQDICASNDTAFDGFVIGDATGSGMYLQNAGSHLTIANCVLLDNGGEGIFFNQSAATLTGCLIKQNGGNGIELSGNGYQPTIDGCIIFDNDDGVYVNGAVPTIRNSFIHKNRQRGINLYYPSGQAEIRNVTLTNNELEAVKQTGGTAAALSNSIFWHNDRTDDYTQLLNCTAEYSCITNPADPNGVATGAEIPDQDGNISCDPDFAYNNPDCVNFHLLPASYCIDLADESLVGQDELDLDGDDRITLADPCVAMGADEVDCDEDVTHDLDFNGDGLVNLVEFAAFSKAWLSVEPGYTQDPNESVNWNGAFDADVDHDIDAVDLAAFAEEWMWVACWKRFDTWTSTAVTMADVPEGSTQSLWLSPEDLLLLKESWWQAHRPDYEPTLFEQIVQLYDIIVWAEDLWLDPQFRQDVDEHEWQAFVADLYAMLDELERQYYGEP